MKLNIFKKFALWLFSAYVAGLVAGVCFGTYYVFAVSTDPWFLYDFYLFRFGLVLSIGYAVFFGIPSFSLFFTVYFLLNKRWKIDKSWWGTIGLAAIVSMVAYIVSSHLMTDASPVGIAIERTLLYSTFISIVLPRVFLRRLKLGMFSR